jgi:acyl-CoA thioesterase
MGTGWEDLDLDGGEGRYHTSISETWQLAIVPQGGIVAAVASRAMARELDHPEQTLRTMTSMFAGQVACGPVEVDVQVLRRGRSMSQLTASVRNVGAEAGLTAIAAFGAPRRGFEFTDLAMPDVPGPDGVLSFRDPPPDGIEFEFSRPNMPFWDSVLQSRPVIGRAPWEEFEDGPAEAAFWYRIDHPPIGADGVVDPSAVIVMCDTMPSSVGQKLGPEAGQWFAPSVDYTLHLFRPPPADWALAHLRARHAGDGYASVELALWDPAGPHLVAYATQVMLFAFGR